MTSLGGTNVQASAPEVRDILEKGVADAVTFPWGSILLFGIDKVTKYHMEAALYTTGFVWVMNKNTYAAMSPSQQKVIDNHCNKEWAEKVASPWADFEHDGIAKLKAEPGQEVYPISDTQLANLWKAAKPPVVKMVRRGEKDRQRSRRDPEGIWPIAPVQFRADTHLPVPGEAAAPSAAGGSTATALALPHPPLRGSPPPGRGG